MGPVEVALETSRRGGSLAVAAGEEVRLGDLSGEHSHASDLLPRLQELLDALGVERNGGVLALRTVFVGTGPGSYTGLRVGIATAQGLCRATGARLCGVPSFDALAWVGLATGEQGAVALDARAGRFYFARYRRSLEGLDVLRSACVVDAAELCAHLRAPGPILGHVGLAEAAGLEAGQVARMRTDLGPDAAAVLALGRLRSCGFAARPESLEPLYLREFGQR